MSNTQLDLLEKGACEQAVRGRGRSITWRRIWAECRFIRKQQGALRSVGLINTHLLMAAKARVSNNFSSSSACVYAADKRVSAEVIPLRKAMRIRQCRGRLRLGEVVQRTNVPPFSRGLRLQTRVSR